MAEIVVRNWRNEALRTLELDDRVFAYPFKEHLVYEAMCAHLAGARRGTHKTKNRSEVSGGTRKPWAQKHTGRARHGDIRSPLWRHGGTVFGPQPRDYRWGMSKRARRNALRSVLALKHRAQELVCLESLELPSPKTREFRRVLREELGLKGKVLFLQEQPHRNLELASRNLPGLKVVPVLGANVVDLLRHDVVVASEAALLRLAEVLTR